MFPLIVSHSWFAGTDAKPTGGCVLANEQADQRLSTMNSRDLCEGRKRWAQRPEVLPALLA